jgi:hypothetical protein
LRSVLGPSPRQALSAPPSCFVRRRSVHAVVLLAWLGAGVITLGAQTWWAYHLILLLPPLGLLAVPGVEWLFSRVSPGWLRGPVLAAALGGLVMPLWLPLEEKLSALARNGFAGSTSERLAYQAEVDSQWARVVREVDFLHAVDAVPGTIYAYDGPLYWYASGRTPAAVADHTYQLPEQRQRWPDAIIGAAPAYLRLPRTFREVLNEIDPHFQEFLDAHYQRVRDRPPWYVRVDGAPASGSTTSAAGPAE